MVETRTAEDHTRDQEMTVHRVRGGHRGHEDQDQTMDTEAEPTKVQEMTGHRVRGGHRDHEDQDQTMVTAETTSNSHVVTSTANRTWDTNNPRWPKLSNRTIFPYRN